MLNRWPCQLPSGLVTQLLQRVAIVVEQLVAVLLHQAGPVIAGKHRALLAIRRPAALVGHQQPVNTAILALAHAHAIAVRPTSECFAYPAKRGVDLFQRRRAVANRHKGKIDIHRQARHVAHKQVDCRPALERET